MKKLLLLFSFSLIVLSSWGLTLRDRVADLEAKGAGGDGEAMYHLSTLYEHGFDSIPADSIRAMELLHNSAAAGYAPAQNYLGFKLYKSDPTGAMEWLSKAAEGGEMKAVSNLAYILLEPDSAINMEERTSRDRRAAELLSQASEAGIAAAMTSLADLYSEGRGVAKDTLKAESLYLEAVGRNFPDAEKKLWIMNADRYNSLSPGEALRTGVRASRAGAYTVAFNLYSRAAETPEEEEEKLLPDEMARLHTLLADAYSSAKGTDYNHDSALRHYALGAIGGDPSAQFILAELLEIFPDALNDMTIDSNALASGDHDQDISKEDLRSPAYWYSRAAASGIMSAREAFARLFDLP